MDVVSLDAAGKWKISQKNLISLKTCGQKNCATATLMVISFMDLLTQLVLISMEGNFLGWSECFVI